jgi:3'-5' exoribonuclease
MVHGRLYIPYKGQITLLTWFDSKHRYHISMTLNRLSVNEAKELLTKFAQELSYPALTAACMKVINDPRFVVQYGSAGSHHAYVGGLIVHTAEVTNYAYTMSQMFHEADEDVVITAGIFHDFMKVKEYELRQKSSPGHVVMDSYGRPATYIGKTDYRNLVRHVAGSHAEFMKLVDDTDVDDGKILKIEHAILAHHGCFEYGSPVEPQTVEARILHYADMMSVNHGPARDAHA